MLDNKIWVFILSACLFNSCTFGLPLKTHKSKSFKKLCHQAIFIYLDQCYPYEGHLFGNGLVKIDPVIVRREKLINNGKIYFDYPRLNELLEHPIIKSAFHLTIPDSLLNKYELIDPSADYEHYYSIIHQFSPLLSTKSPNVFLMEHAVWANACSGRNCIRMLIREHIAFEIINGSILCRNELTSNEWSDIIGFGGFNREKLEKALSNDKIIKFGSGNTDNH